MWLRKRINSSPAPGVNPLQRIESCSDDGRQEPGEIERRSGDVEIRLAGRELSGVLIRYGDLGQGGKERFSSGAFSPLPVGQELNLQHDPSLRLGVPTLDDSPVELRLSMVLPTLSAAIQLIARGSLRGLSTEFVSLAERRDGDVRVIDRARLVGMALVDIPSYGTSTVEVK